MTETYQDMVNRLDAEVEAAITANQPEIVCKKLNEISDTYISWGLNVFSTTIYSDAYNCFNLAYQKAGLFSNYFNALPADKQDKEMSRHNQENLLHASGYANFSLGQWNNTTRNPGVAVPYFEQAKKDFESLSKISENKFWGIFAKYCDSFKLYAEGLEDLMRASFANAKMKLHRSMITIGNLVEKEIPAVKNELNLDEKTYEDSLNRFKADYQTIRSVYYLSEAKLQFGNRNFKSAANKFDMVAQQYDVVIKQYAAQLDAPINNLTLGEYHQYVGWKLLSEAEACREEEKWDESLKRYELVRAEWEKAAGYYLQSGHAMSVALQESLTNASLSLDVYQRECEKEKELKERISELENEIEELNSNLKNAMKSAGVVIHNNQEVVTTVSQNVQFIQTIENNARREVEELMKILKSLPLADADKKNAEKKGEEVLKSEEKGTKFLDKVKDFTGDIAAIIKNVKDIAGPLIPGWKLLSFLF